MNMKKTLLILAVMMLGSTGYACISPKMSSSAGADTESAETEMAAKVKIDSQGGKTILLAVPSEGYWISDFQVDGITDETQRGASNKTFGQFINQKVQLQGDTPEKYVLTITSKDTNASETFEVTQSQLIAFMRPPAKSGPMHFGQGGATPKKPTVTASGCSKKSGITFNF